MDWVQRQVLRTFLEIVGQLLKNKLRNTTSNV